MDQFGLSLRERYVDIGDKYTRDRYDTGENGRTRVPTSGKSL